MICLSLVLIVSILINVKANADDTYKIFMERMEGIGNKQHGSIIKDVSEYDSIIIKSMIDIVTDSNNSNTHRYFTTITNNSIIFQPYINTKDMANNNITIETNFTIVDFRLISIGTKAFVIFIDTTKQLLSYSPFHTSGTKIQINDDDIVYIDTKNSPDECKNLKTWMPVPNTDVKKEGHPGFAFVCSIYPHRIVVFDASSNTTKRSMTLLIDDKRMKESMTVIAHDDYAEYFIQLIWPFGHPIIASTVPIKVNTIDGERYLSFFSSSGTVMSVYTTSSFFGVYLYSTRSPYGITHISIDPIVPKQIYSINKTWVNENTDYYARVSGCSLDINQIIVSVESSTASYIMVIDLEKLISSLRSVSSQTLKEMYVLSLHNNRILPTYQLSNLLLFNDFRAKQHKSFIINDWKLSGNRIKNPSIVLVNSSILLTTCIPYDYIRSRSLLCQYKLYDSRSFYSGSSISTTENVTLVIGPEDSDNLYEALWADDMRLINDGTNMFGIYNKCRPRSKNDPNQPDMYIIHLYTKPNQVFTKELKIFMNVEHIVGTKPQKNWTPFFCNDSNSERIYDKICFVYSIVPHKILKFSNDAITYDSTNKFMKANMTFIAETKNDYLVHKVWKYGQPRGGSQAELIDTPYGKRYLTFFHSSIKRGYNLVTYFGGAYLFQSENPYEITHISSEPLSPKSLYNVSQGWMSKTLDFVVFPTAFIKTNDTLYVSFGVQDSSGYIVALNCTSFLLSLTPLPT